MDGQGGHSSLAEIQLEHSQDWNKSRGANGRISEVERDGELGCCGCVLFFFSILIVIFTFPFSLCFCIKVVAEYERAVIFRLGRVLADGPQGPGMVFVFPCADEMQMIDLRTVAYDVPPQEVLTRDSVTVTVDAVVYYNVSDPVVAICNVNDAFRSAQFLAATTLRNVLGTKLMVEVLSERDHIAQSMKEILDHSTHAWGITIERVEVKDVRLPNQLQRAMAAEAEATREAKAKVVAAEGECNASRALKEAADVISQSPAAMQLRYLQTLGSVAEEQESTILFPMPLDIMGMYSKKGEKSPFQKKSPPKKKKENEQKYREEMKEKALKDDFSDRKKDVYGADITQYEFTNRSEEQRESYIKSANLPGADSRQPDIRISANLLQSEAPQTFHKEEVTSVHAQRTETQVYKTSAYSSHTEGVTAEKATAVIIERLDKEPPKRTSAGPSIRQREPDAADVRIRTSAERTVLRDEKRPLLGSTEPRKSTGSEAGSSRPESGERSSAEIKKGKHSSTIIITKNASETTYL